MRKVILHMQVTLDGFIEGPNVEMDWLIYDDDEQWKDLFAWLKSVDTFLLGRVMYPDYANYWSATLTNPSGSKNELEYARIAEKTQHIIFSKTLDKVDLFGKNSRIARDDIEREILKLKQQPGQDMALWGGASLASSFIKLGLIDEYQLFINPVLLGRGKSLFKDLKDRHKLKLINTKIFKNGVVLLHYELDRKSKEAL